MVIRFSHMIAHHEAAAKKIDRACADLCNGSLEKLLKMKEQFYILPNLDVYIDDDMPEIEYGYILKCLRALHLCDSETIVPSRYHTSDIFLRDIATENESVEPDDEDDNLIYLEEYIPLSAYDDGHFEEEMEAIRNMRDEDDE